MKEYGPSYSTVAASTAFFFAAAFVASELVAQPDDDAVFRGRERVTAIDLLLEFETTTAHELRSNRLLPKDLRPDELEVLYSGESQTVVAIQEVEALDSAGGDWEIVIYFDAVLSTNRGLRWAATSLADRIDQLTALGTVELVWADPFPKTLVEATRDSAELHLQLAEIAQFGKGRDELVTLRYQFLEELRASAADPETDAESAHHELAARELAGWVAAEEARIVRRQQDAVLTWLTGGQPERDLPSGRSARKLLFLVNNGYDLDPDAFYREALAAVTDTDGDSGESLGESVEDAALVATTEDLARGLSAYGWLAFNLILPPPPPPPEGVRIGKWLLTPAKPKLMVPDPRYRPHSPADRHTERSGLDAIWIFIGGIGGKYQEQREPERAEAYLELGRAQEAKSDLVAAEDAYRKAFYHFADDPRTATLQGEALIGLGRVLERQGRQESRRVFELAHQRAPELFAEKLGASAALRDPAAPMERLARATAGWVLRDADKIEDALATLDLRVRITYQVSGPADGLLHPVEVRCNRSGYRVRFPTWARSATPEIVSAARARRLLANPGLGRLDGDLRLQADLQSVGPSPTRPGEFELVLAVIPTRPWLDDDDRKLRISLGFGGSGLSQIRVEHHQVERQRSSGEPWTASLRFPWPEGVDRDETEWLAVVVEDVDSASWGAGLVDLYGLD